MKKIEVPTVLRTPMIAGVDPDIDKSGLAIWHRKENRFILLRALDFGELQATIRAFPPQELAVVVEAGWLNEGLHEKRKVALHERNFNSWPLSNQHKYMFKLGVDTGMNFAPGRVLVHYLKVHGYQVKEERPVTAKWNAAIFKRYTGSTKGYNQEVRDAAKLVFQR